MLYPSRSPRWRTSSAPFNLFRYITFRSGGAVLTALLISFVLGPRDHRAGCKSKQGEGQPIRTDGPRDATSSQEGHADDGRAPDPARR